MGLGVVIVVLITVWFECCCGGAELVLDLCSSIGVEVR